MDKNGKLVERMMLLLRKKPTREGREKGRLVLLRGGSDRKIYRFRSERDYVVMVSPTAREVNEYLQIQRHLLNCGVGVPEVYASSSKDRMVIMEDIGSRSLQRIVSSSDTARGIEKVYRKVLEALLHLQLQGSANLEKCTPVYRRIFDYDVLRWESDYFRKEFLERLCGCTQSATEKLQDDFHRLARALTAEPLYFMHRDFQSTNIFVRSKRVRIVDFQSAHRGMLSYDLAALLRDAYVPLPRKTRDALFRHYFELLNERSAVYRNLGAFRRVYVLSGIQRNMQALGAFSFLSREKKKRWFLKAIPRALVYLREGLDEAGTFRKLRNMAYSEGIEACVHSMSS
jgi:aminoglycoside/choline kinase family phosphotransferase